MRKDIKLPKKAMRGRGKGRIDFALWGSLALFVCMNVGYGDCESKSGAIGICVDGKGDQSSEFKITWNGLHGKGEVYQPLKKGGTPVKNLSFVFDSNAQDDDLVAKVIGSTLEVNGNGKSLQMDDGSGTIAFLLKDDGEKAITLNLGKKDSYNFALRGNLIVDGELETNTFTGTFGGRGISGDVKLGSFGANTLSFTDEANIEGRVTLEAGENNIKSEKSSTTIKGGIYSERGEGEITFEDKSVQILGNLDSDGKNNGEGAIVANGGEISLKMNTEQQTITIANSISVGAKNTSSISINISQKDSKLILNGISTQDGGSGAKIQFDGEDATLVFKEKPQSDQQYFSLWGNDSSITFGGKDSKILGNISTLGTGKYTQPILPKRGFNIRSTKQAKNNLKKNHIVFNGDNGSITGNIYAQKGGNEISFKGKGTNTITGNITSKSGDNSILFENGDSDTSNAIVGNISTWGLSGETSITFKGEKAKNTIQGNVSTSSGRTTISFFGNGSISGKVYAGADDNNNNYGESLVWVSSSNRVEIGGLGVGGKSQVFNRVRGENGTAKILPITSGDGKGSSIYAKNPHGANSIQIPNGTLATQLGVVAVYGRNLFNVKSISVESDGFYAIGSSGYSAQNSVIAQNATIDGDITTQTSQAENMLDFKGNGSVKLGSKSPTSIRSESGVNVLSFGSRDDNILNLTSITTNGGSNILGKVLFVDNKSFNRLLGSYSCSSSNAFSGKMTISQGIRSTGKGKNTILFSGNHSQNSSVISHFATTSSSFTLKDAIYGGGVEGGNSVWIDISSSALTHPKEAIETFLKSEHSPKDQEDLALSSTISGDITSKGGSNRVFIKGGKDDKPHSALFGNISTEKGSNDLIFEDSIIIPSFLISSDSKTSKVGGELSGNITTRSGTTSISMRLSHYPTDKDDVLSYNLNSLGGETSITFVGKINAKIKTQYSKESHTTLIFAQSSSEESQTIDLSKPQDSTATYQGGFKVKLQGAPTSSPLSATIKSVQTTQGHSLSLGGVGFGNVTLLDLPNTQGNQSPQPTISHTVTIEEHSEFWGNVKPNTDKHTLSLTLKENAKIFFKDIGKDSNNNFSIPTLCIDNKAKDSNHFSATISVVSDKNSDDFGLLTIGDSDKKEGSGLQGESGGLFLTRVNTKADQSKVRLGGEKTDKYGYTYSDRIIIKNIRDNSTAQNGEYFIGFFVENGKGIKEIKYNPSQDGKDNAGGTKTLGNIAVLTVVNTSDSKAGISLKLQDTLQGYDTLSGTLTSKTTDINGVVKENGGYTTYFIDDLHTNGVSQERGDVSATALGVNYDLYMANLNSLNKRMGELRENHHSQGVWARIFGGVVGNGFGLGTKTSYITLQGGYDYAFGFEGANNYLGVALSYSTSYSKIQNTSLQAINQEALGVKNVKSSAVEVALYNSYVQDEGWYNDSILKFVYLSSHLGIIGEDLTYGLGNTALVLSDEFGYRFKLGGEREWFIDPQIEVAFGYFSQVTLKQFLQDSWLENFAKAIITMRSRLGSSFGYDFKRFTKHKPIQASVYVGLFYEYDYVSGGDISLTTNLGGASERSGAISSDGRVVGNVGVNVSVKDHTRFYFDIEKSFGGKINTEYQVNVGVRYSFGENHRYIPQTKPQRESPPLKIEQIDWEE